MLLAAFPAEEVAQLGQQLQQDTNPRMGCVVTLGHRKNDSHPFTPTRYSLALAAEAEEPVPGW